MSNYFGLYSASSDYTRCFVCGGAIFKIKNCFIFEHISTSRLLFTSFLLLSLRSQVPYIVVDTLTGHEVAVTSLSQWPQEASAAAAASGKSTYNATTGRSRYMVKEPMVLATILTPAEFLGPLLEEFLKRRGKLVVVHRNKKNDAISIDIIFSLNQTIDCNRLRSALCVCSCACASGEEWTEDGQEYRSQAFKKKTKGTAEAKEDTPDEDEDEDNDELDSIDEEDEGEELDYSTMSTESSSITYLDDGRALVKYYLPWAEVVVDFHDRVKNLTSGYVCSLFNNAFADTLSLQCYESILFHWKSQDAFICFHFILYTGLHSFVPILVLTKLSLSYVDAPTLLPILRAQVRLVQLRRSRSKKCEACES